MALAGALERERAVGELTNHLDFWGIVLVFALGAYYLVWKDRVQPFLRSFLPPREERPRARRPSIARLRGRPRPIRTTRGRFAGSLPGEATPETNRNEGETHFDTVSGVATGNTDAETVAFHFLARLIKAGHVTETQALESACEVKAGSSKAYQESRAKLKRALEQVTKEAGAAVELERR